MHSAILIFIFVIAMFFFRYFRRKLTGQGASTKEIESTSLTTTHGVINFRYQPPRYHKGREVEAPYVEISVPAKSSGAFSLWSRSTVNKTLTAMGFYPEIKGESWSDPSGLLSGYVFAASDREAGLRLLSGQRSRLAIKTMADLGFTRFDHDGEHLKARYMPFRTDPSPNQLPFLADGARALHDWAGLVRSSVGESEAGAQVRYVQMMRLLNHKGFTVLLVVGLIVGIVAGALLSSMNRLLEYTPFIKTWLTLTGIGGVIALWQLRNLTRRVLIDGQTLMSLMILPVIMLGALLWTGLYGINTSFDRSPVLTKEAPVIDARRTRQKRGYSYTLVVQSWKDPSDTFDIKVSSDIFERAAPGGAVVQLKLKKGFLGWEWIVSKDVFTPQH